MPDYSKRIIYLSDVQREALFADGTITVDGVTITYSDNDIYVTPQSAPVTDVQVNGTSVVQNGVANVPRASTSNVGVVKINNGYGVSIENGSGSLYLNVASVNELKSGSDNFKPSACAREYVAVYYALAKAAGADMKNVSGETVGVYPEEQKAAIRTMLGATSSNIVAITDTQPTDADNKIWIAETAPSSVQVPTVAEMNAALAGKADSAVVVEVSGSTPSITAASNTRYVCGEVSTISFTPSSYGLCEVIFESGTTATILTLPNTVKMPEWFDSTSLEANKIYDISVADGVYGAVMTWAST